jgi:hypothetical protein
MSKATVAAGAGIYCRLAITQYRKRMPTPTIMKKEISSFIYLPIYLQDGFSLCR